MKAGQSRQTVSPAAMLYATYPEIVRPRAGLSCAPEGDFRVKIGTLLGIVVFSLVAVAHLLRLLMGWQVSIDGWIAPMWSSVIGVLLPGSIAYLLWKESP